MKLYKFFPKDSALKFIKNPILRVTQPGLLNDPFEGVPPKQLFPRVTSCPASAELAEGATSLLSQDRGIISFTRCYKNLLMWAHYGDEHKGMVVEFEVDSNLPFELFDIDLSDDALEYCFFNDVDYAYFRDDEKNFEQNSLWKTEDHVFRIAKSYFFKKSLDWEYEAESRFVFPALLASCIKPKDKTQYDESTDHEGFFTGERPADMGYSEYSEYWQARGAKEAMFFVPIKKGKITRYIVGANADDMQYKEAFKSSCIVAPCEKASVCPDEFKLLFNTFEI